MASNSILIHKLQQALNLRGEMILYNTSQFYSTEQDRPVTVYHVKKAVWDEKKGKNINIELFKSTSQIQILLFLRDMWYEVNGWELPEGDEEWTTIRERLKNGKEKNDADNKK